MTADARLVECVLDGDSDAFGELVRRYERRAFAIAYRLLGHQQDAEDLVQDGFMVALDRLERFDLKRPFGPWFFRILVNLGYNALGARRVRETEELDEEVAGVARVAGEGGLEKLERDEVAERVQAAVADLTDQQRLVVQLHELEEFSTREVSEILEIAEPTVRWTLHSARKRLREVLADWKKEER